MNMLLHGVEHPDIRYRDSLAENADDDADEYSLILANPPFAGSLDYESTSKDLLRVVKTKKTELPFLALFLRLLRPGGSAAVIVPEGVRRRHRIRTVPRQSTCLPARPRESRSRAEATPRQAALPDRPS